MDIPFEQLVYGSFPFWDRGYDVLARSPGCRPDWAAEVLAACRKFGEAPAGVAPCPAFFSLRLPSGLRAIVGVEPLGADDRGRPGALAFHALIVQAGDFRKAGSDPFAFAGALRREWLADSTLAASSLAIDPPSGLAFPPGDHRAPRIARALAKGRRVALESAGPIDGLAREAWRSLPASTRFKASVATWAFGNANRFDLVALPRLAGVELDRSYLDPPAIDADPEPARRPFPDYSYQAALAAVGLVALGVVAWRGWTGGSTPRPPAPSTSSPTAEAVDLTPAGRARAVAGLEVLADRLELGGSNDPGDLIGQIADRWHYRGPTLSPAELARLAAEVDPDRDRALGWHDRIARTFIDDRPLPASFTGLPLPSQLEGLARSFHLDPIPPPDAVPGALLDLLAREGPVRPTPLASRYPALSDYARFLGKLPRKAGR